MKRVSITIPGENIHNAEGLAKLRSLEAVVQSHVDAKCCRPMIGMSLHESFVSMREGRADELGPPPYVFWVAHPDHFHINEMINKAMELALR